MMRFAYTVVPDIPPLAWCALVEPGRSSVEVWTGRDVERSERFFVEGAWTGSFARGELGEATFLAGSGAELIGDRVVFCAPSHTLERLWSMRRASGLLVSNSLPMVLSVSGERLDPLYGRYRSDLRSIAHGLRRQVRSIPCLGGARIEMTSHANLAVSESGESALLEKPWPPGFGDFAAYRRFLIDAIASLRENAAAPERSRRYVPLATVSRGYDSPACAALANEAGCNEAVSYRTGFALHGGEDTGNDNGAEIARALALPLHEIEANAYERAANLEPAEFGALGDTFDVQFAGMEDLLPGRMLCTGFHGDGVWERTLSEVSSDIVRNGPASGASLGEFRLRVGFVHLPVPFIGCRRHAEIHAISNAPEMKPWVLGTDYDRPIPRRILEERGVPRAAFGQVKRASVAMLDRGMPRHLLAGLEKFYASNRRRRSPSSRGVAWARYAVEQLRFQLEHAIARAGLPLPAAPLNRSVIEKPNVGSYAVLWGVAELLERYRTVSGRPGSASDPARRSS